MTFLLHSLSRQRFVSLLASAFFCLCCLNAPVSGNQEKMVTAQEKTTKNQQGSPNLASKKEDKPELTPKEKEKNVALDVREKETALERLQLTQKCTAAELELKKNIAQEKQKAAKEDLDLFLTNGKERAIAAANLQLTRAHDQYEYKKEELDQLKQMYTEDQLTDTSEEIVLKRCTREMEDAKFDYDGKVVTTRFEIDVKIPRKEQELKMPSPQLKTNSHVLSWK